MQVTRREIARRKALMAFTEHDVAQLLACKPFVEDEVDEIVETFYAQQTGDPEICGHIC